MPAQPNDSALTIDAFIRRSAADLSAHLSGVALRSFDHFGERHGQPVLLCKEVIVASINCSHALTAEIAPFLHDLRKGRETWHFRQRENESKLANWLDWFELGIHLLQSGLICFQEAIKQVRSNEQHLIEAVSRLCISAIHISEEIGCLLRNGFATGAFARWRTLDEVAIVCRLISSSGDETAIRFLDHRYVKQFEDRNRAVELFGSLYEMPGDLLVKIEYLKNKYGEDYLGGYGWAKAAIRQLDPEFKGSLNLMRIQKYVGLEQWEVHHRKAAHRVHATSRFAQEYSVDLLEADSDEYDRAVCSAISSSLMSMGIIIAALMKAAFGDQPVFSSDDSVMCRLFLHERILRRSFDAVTGQDSDAIFRKSNSYT